MTPARAIRSVPKDTNPSEDVLKAPPHCIGPEKSVLSSILADSAKFIRLALHEGLDVGDFYLPAHRHLFTLLIELHEAQEQIELVSLIQHLLDRGLLDRVGGPSALTDIHNYACTHEHFATHLQQVKDKSLLRDIIARSNAQIKAAYESPGEVKELVEQVSANAAEIKEKTENRASDFKRYREQIVTSESMREPVIAYLNGDTVLGGDGFFLSPFDFACRKHECTVWLGSSFHGKSQAVQNQIAYLAALGRPSMVASFEQPPEITLGQILKAMTAYPEIARTAEFEPAWIYVNRMVSMYKGQKRTSPKHLVQTFRQAYLNDGTDTFLIDNLMTMQVDRGDNSALAHAIDLLRVFVSEYPIHLHLVTHPRKPSADQGNKAPVQADIRGPAEIGDMPQNVIVVWRDMDKSKKLAEMDSPHFSPTERLLYHRSTPCGKISVEKQRLTGKMPIRETWFDESTNRFLDTPGNALPMFGNLPPWE